MHIEERQESDNPYGSFRNLVSLTSSMLLITPSAADTIILSYSGTFLSGSLKNHNVNIPKAANGQRRVALRYDTSAMRQ
ncbi:MAG: hypothetical protein U9O53_03285 [archaeon]|nr:hypothetical protein [archaeon]